MKGIIFRKAFLLGGIFLLATFMLAQLSWGRDDDDDDNDNHGKHCRRQLVIQSVDVDLENNQILIHGQNFDNGRRPVVTLGGSIDLEVRSYTGDEIVTKLSEDNLEDIKDSDYRLVVSAGRGKKCRDRYSLTIAGPLVPPSTIGLKIESKTVTLTELGTEKMITIEDEVRCVSGFGVTGGGFSCSNIDACTDGLRIIASEPLQDDKNNSIGWHIIATYVGAPAQLTIRAICAQAQ